MRLNHDAIEAIAIALAGDDLGLTPDEVRNEWEGGEFTTADMAKWRGIARQHVVAATVLTAFEEAAAEMSPLQAAPMYEDPEYRRAEAKVMKKTVRRGHVVHAMNALGINVDQVASVRIDAGNVFVKHADGRAELIVIIDGAA